MNPMFEPMAMQLRQMNPAINRAVDRMSESMRKGMFNPNNDLSVRVLLAHLRRMGFNENAVENARAQLRTVNRFGWSNGGPLFFSDLLANMQGQRNQPGVNGNQPGVNQPGINGNQPGVNQPAANQFSDLARTVCRNQMIYNSVMEITSALRYGQPVRSNSPLVARLAYALRTCFPGIDPNNLNAARSLFDGANAPDTATFMRVAFGGGGPVQNGRGEMVNLPVDNG